MQEKQSFQASYVKILVRSQLCEAQCATSAALLLLLMMMIDTNPRH
jgi:hypothetical protein